MTPDISLQRPKVLFWFKAYSGFLCILYLAVAGFGLYCFWADPSDLDMSKPAAQISAAAFLFLGLALFIACLLPLILTPRPWVWTYDLVVICMGMTSACFLPVCIPLLIYWLKPETKRYFGKS